MSGSVSELSPAGIYELGADLRELGHKTGLGWLQLAGHLRRFGSIPSDERSVASILGVTVRFMRERAWPLLEDRLTLSDDGRRYTCPDITPWSGRQRTAARAPDRDGVKSPQQQNAANIRWGKSRQQHPEAHTEAHASASEPHAETHVISMRSASETHAENAHFASPGASGAHARALSPSGTSLSESPDNWRDSLGEREGATMRDDAPAHADRINSDASAHASSDAPAHASRRKKSPPVTRPSVPIPPDWMPTPEDALAARGRGFDSDELARGFRDWYLGKDESSPDWNAKFRTWMRREKSPPVAQGSMKLPIEGGAPDETDDPAAAVGDTAEAQWVRATRKLKADLGGVVYRSWMLKATLIGIEHGVATISFPTRFVRDYVSSHFLTQLTMALRAEDPALERIETVIEIADRRVAGD